MDKQTNGTQCTPDQLIQSGTATTDPTICEFQSLANVGRFKVFSDKMFKRPQPPITYDGTNIEASGSITLYKFVKVFKRPIMIHFNAGSAGTVADIVDNSFHIAAADEYGNQANEFAYKCRVAFCE